MNSRAKETIWSHMYLGRGLDWDVLLLLITDDAYSPSIEEEIPNLRPRERMRALEDHSWTGL